MADDSAIPGGRKPAGRTATRRLLFGLRRLMDRWQSRHIHDHRRALAQLGKVAPYWRQRIDTVLSAPDNAHIPRVPDAGTVRDGFLTMHNGIEVAALGHYGSGMLNLLAENRGVHEPQEERAFAQVLPHVPAGSAMIELGAYWGFYSLWFAAVVPGAQSFLIEPSFANLRSARVNFARAGRSAVFAQAYVSAQEGTSRGGTPIVTVDGFCRRAALHSVAILHADIQGAEVDMLRGADALLRGHRVALLFISTHSNPLHAECVRILRGHGYEILASADLEESYSEDGLVVAARPGTAVPSPLAVTQRPTMETHATS